MKILVVEDDDLNALLLQKALKAYNFQIETANDGQYGLELAKIFEFDLLLVDVMLPKMDGISLCRQLRQEGYQVPILMLSAVNSTSLRVTAIEVGADDFLVKPVEISELVARIRALLRRGRIVTPTVLSWENLQLDTNIREVTYNGKTVHLSRKEYGLLELLLRNPRKTFSRSALLNSVWSCFESPGEEAVTTQIKGLRQKLKAVGLTKDLIETVYGLGYRLRENQKGTSEQESHNHSRHQSTLHTELLDKHKAEAEVRVLVKKIWEEFRDSSLEEQLELFEQVLAHLLTGNRNNQLLEQAQTQAHRLAGTLGCYGLHQGSEIAKEIEVYLQALSIEKQSPTPELKKLEKLITSLKKILHQQASTPATRSTSKLSSAQVLIIDDDTVFTERIKVEAATWGLEVEVATDLTIARSLLSQRPPDVILLDLTFSNSQENGLAFLAQIHQEMSEIPVIVFIASEEFRCRVEAARLGAYIFLQKSISIDEVLFVVKTALHQHIAPKAKIMVVDDDPITLNHVKTLLLPWVFNVTTLQHPQQFWKVLEATTPDLLILDIEMPDFNGIELCQVVRKDSRWSHLPVLFLSVHCDAKIVHQVYTAGADDYVCKQFMAQELITRILNRLERTRIQKLTLSQG
ncbi:multi-component transcriptional regulator [Brasilonema octagenarum UFV-E1]|uniref:Multi-component transcriptional regulator n=2 Tax=Brasilonema TaxID=383614 RepID=A0A856MLR4_9CYAN|nr:MULTISPECIES: response regulator [Brasilonema]NMF65973.1 multi-component transcriptional regulator [Brasilonema octagenarum UFV-OR1]QDL10491.1 multi-component transcriptional regulator [Brasilonema sennae CENA114]QDL16837.1 multi-component transcriptional regulator [Brasilonema octagenarum UFV-E1]